MKYKLLQNITDWENWTNNTDPKWYDANWYKQGDIIEFNEWVGNGMYGKSLDTYPMRMFSKGFVETRKDLFEKID